ncbi:hypothetical protein F183_A16160 [Bryobacterales bacterium F-183]|nr:hypothetical protein F183_A16160 [Bryobacterales bacterium F-183]
MLVLLPVLLLHVAQDVKIHNPEGMHKPTGYSHVVEVRDGKQVYIAGQVAMDAEGNLVGKDDFEARVQAVFANLDKAVKAAGGTFANVVKLNIYCVDRVDRGKIPALRQIRDRFVNTKNPPASTLVFVRDLVRPEWLVEIEAVAVVKK